MPTTVRPRRPIDNKTTWQSGLCLSVRVKSQSSALQPWAAPLKRTSYMYATGSECDSSDYEAGDDLAGDVFDDELFSSSDFDDY